MAFTLDDTTSRGRVRLLAADVDTTKAANQIFTDSEIDAFLALANQNVWQAAAHACRSIAASRARVAIAYRALGTSIDMKEIPKHFMALAEAYEKRAMEPSEEIDSMDYEISRWGRDLSEYVGDEV